MRIHRRSLPYNLLGFPNNLPVPIYNPGWREALWELSVFSKNTTQCPWPGLEPGHGLSFLEITTEPLDMTVNVFSVIWGHLYTNVTLTHMGGILVTSWHSVIFSQQEGNCFLKSEGTCIPLNFCIIFLNYKTKVLAQIEFMEFVVLIV